MAHAFQTFCGLILGRKYRLDRYLGQSEGHALFTSTQPDGEVLVRVVPSDSPKAPDLRRSWSLASGLSHDHLLRVHATGEAELDGSPVVYSVTERPDDNLGSLLESRATTAPEALEVLRSVLGALEYLHKNGIVHGGVRPENILATGTSVKLGVDTLHPIDSRSVQRGSLTPANAAADVTQLGATLIQMFTQKRPASGSEAEQIAANANLPHPIREIVLGSVRDERLGKWTLRRIRQELDPTPPTEQPATPAETRPASRKLSAGIAIGVIAALLLVVFAVRRMHNAPVATHSETPMPDTRARVVFPPPPAAVPQEPRPSPFNTAPTSKALKTATLADWAVVAAIYKDYDAAENRAKSLQKKWPGSELQVYPAKGSGRQYMVVVASGLSKDEAEKAKRKAVSAGMPKDTYVTRLRG